MCSNSHSYKYGEHLLEYTRMLKDFYDYADDISFTSKEREEYPTDMSDEVLNSSVENVI